MIGTLRWNFVVGAVSCCLTFLFSFMHNPWMITFIHSMYSFIALFVFSFLFRWILGTVVGLKALVQVLEQAQEQVSENKEEANKGQSIDIVTPDDVQAPQIDESNRLSGISDFKPLTP